MEDVALFSTPPVNTAEENKVWIEYQPTFQAGGEYSCWDFFIPGNSLQYVDLSNTELYTVIEIVKEDGTAFDMSKGKDESTLPIDTLPSTSCIN